MEKGGERKGGEGSFEYTSQHSGPQKTIALSGNRRRDWTEKVEKEQEVS